MVMDEYCGTSDSNTAYEWEYQLPLSLGWGRSSQHIDSCRACYRFKTSVPVCPLTSFLQAPQIHAPTSALIRLAAAPAALRPG
jgi:hypothetical protein